MNLTMIASVIAAALVFGAAWTLQGRAIDSLKLEHANERIVNQAAARHTIERNTSALVKAQNKAMDGMNTRGLLSSSMAQGAGVAAQRHGRCQPSHFNLTKENL